MDIKKFCKYGRATEVEEMKFKVKNDNYRESSAPSGKVPLIKSPHTTTYKMQVISSSII